MGAPPSSERTPLLAPAQSPGSASALGSAFAPGSSSSGSASNSSPHTPTLATHPAGVGVSGVVVPPPLPELSERAARPPPLKDSMSRARLVLILAGIWSSNFTFAFQVTAIPTLAPTISSSFAHAELASYLGSAFSLGNTVGIPVYGVLIETLGRRFAMLTACAFFGVGTVACALASDMYTLILARALAGLGGGGLLTVSAVICTDLVHLRERGFYQGIMMTIFGLGSTIGGPLSGWLTDHYAWQLSFWVQVPIILWCATVVGTALPDPPIAPTHRSALAGLASLDWTGILLLLGTVCALMTGLSLHTSYFRPWSDPAVWGALLAATAGSVAFVVAEARATNPVVPLALFRGRQLRAIWLAGTCLLISSQAFLFQVPMYFTVLLDSTAARAGLVVSICSGIGLSSGSLLSGYLIRRGGRYTLFGVIALIPPIAACFAAAMWTPAWPEWSYYATVLPSSIGYAIFLNVSLISLISSVDVHTMPKATALLYSVRSLGGTLGISLGGSIQVGVLVRSLQQRFAGVPPAQRARIINAVVHSKAAIRALPPKQQARALDAYAISLSATWVAAGCVAVCTFVSAMFIRQMELPGRDDRGHQRHPQPAKDGTNTAASRGDEAGDETYRPVDRTSEA